jgi:hypothetical protein
MHSAGRLRKATALGAAFFLLSAEMPAAADSLVAHHAQYLLSLGRDSKNSQVTGADGLMVVDLKDTCDGWATDIKLKLIMSIEGGESGTLEMTQVTWESKDGTSYRYMVKNSNGAGREDQYRGEAHIDAATGKGKVTSDLPSRSESALPDHTLFPIAHTRLILEKAAAGESVVSAEYFDGASSTGTMQVSAVIGPAEKDWAGLPKKIPDLAGKNSYPIGLAYFEGEGNEGGVPEQEQFLQLYDNGVLGSLSVSFGTIKVHAVLDSLKLQPEPAC